MFMTMACSCSETKESNTRSSAWKQLIDWSGRCDASCERIHYVVAKQLYATVFVIHLDRFETYKPVCFALLLQTKAPQRTFSLFLQLRSYVGDKGPSLTIKLLLFVAH